MPSIAPLNGIYQYADPGGSATVSNMWETFYGSGVETAASNPSLVITPAAGGSPVLSTSTGFTQTSQGTFQFIWAVPATTAPGDYIMTWTATTLSGSVIYTQGLNIAQFPALTPSPGVYASNSQYRAWSADNATPDYLVTINLRRASEIMDVALVGAVYKTDPSGMPTDPGVVDVFMRATCAQVQFMIANNDITNVKSQYAVSAMGGVSLTRAAGNQGVVLPPLAPQAAAILRVAGVLPSAPLINW